MRIVAVWSVLGIVSAGCQRIRSVPNAGAAPSRASEGRATIEFYYANGTPIPNEVVLGVSPESRYPPLGPSLLTSEQQTEQYALEFLQIAIPDFVWSTAVTRRMTNFTLYLMDAGQSPPSVATLDPTHEKSGYYNLESWLVAFEMRDPLRLSELQRVVDQRVSLAGRDDSLVTHAYLQLADDGNLTGWGVLSYLDSLGLAHNAQSWSIETLMKLPSSP